MPSSGEAPPLSLNQRVRTRVLVYEDRGTTELKEIELAALISLKIGFVSLSNIPAVLSAN